MCGCREFCLSRGLSVEVEHPTLALTSRLVSADAPLAMTGSLKKFCFFMEDQLYNCNPYANTHSCKVIFPHNCVGNSRATGWDPCYPDHLLMNGAGYPAVEIHFQNTLVISHVLLIIC